MELEFTTSCFPRSPAPQKSYGLVYVDWPCCWRGDYEFFLLFLFPFIFTFHVRYSQNCHVCIFFLLVSEVVWFLIYLFFLFMFLWRTVWKLKLYGCKIFFSGYFIVHLWKLPLWLYICLSELVFLVLYCVHLTSFFLSNELISVRNLPYNVTTTFLMSFNQVL